MVKVGSTRAPGDEPRGGDPPARRQARPSVVAVGVDAETLAALEPRLESRFELIPAASEEEALGLLERGEIAVLWIGPGLPGESAARLAALADHRSTSAGCLHVLLAASRDDPAFDRMVSYLRGLVPEESQPTPEADGEPAGRSQLFRREALRQYASGGRSQGDLLRVAPRWASWSYWILLAVVAAGLLYSLFGTIHEYASGPAVVQLEGHTTLTAPTAGIVTSVSVRPGDRVSAGQAIAALYEADEAAELARIEHEIELQLLERLKRPSDDSTAHALISLRAQRELARARLRERTVRAPADGAIGDVRARPGQYLTPGQVVATLVNGPSRPAVVALLPGRFRPLLAAGMSLRLQLDGYPRQPQDLRIEVVSDEVIGPKEAARYLGSEVADAIGVDGPLVMVRAPLEARSLDAEDRRFDYHDGMQGVAEVPVRSERLLEALLPRLKAVLGRPRS